MTNSDIHTVYLTAQQLEALINRDQLPVAPLRETPNDGAPFAVGLIFLVGDDTLKKYEEDAEVMTRFNAITNIFGIGEVVAETLDEA